MVKGSFIPITVSVVVIKILLAKVKPQRNHGYISLKKFFLALNIEYRSMISTLIPLTPHYNESPGRLGIPRLGNLITVVASGDIQILIADALANHNCVLIFHIWSWKIYIYVWKLWWHITVNNLLLWWLITMNDWE